MPFLHNRVDSLKDHQRQFQDPELKYYILKNTTVIVSYIQILVREREREREREKEIEVFIYVYISVIHHACINYVP
jgi:hypothetical protein